MLRFMTRPKPKEPPKVAGEQVDLLVEALVVAAVTTGATRGNTPNHMNAAAEPDLFQLVSVCNTLARG